MHKLQARGVESEEDILAVRSRGKNMQKPALLVHVVQPQFGNLHSNSIV